MAKKKGKSVSFDAMIKFFMSTYSIPTKRDVEKLVERLDRIERAIVALSASRSRRNPESRAQDKQNTATASDQVLEVIGRYPEGVGLAEIKLQTGHEDKKLRNILFRLHKLGKIQRKSRGIYVQA
jgi:type IV secretory pathway VirB4 component